MLFNLNAPIALAYQPDAYALSDNGERLAVLDSNAGRLRLFDALSGKIMWEKQLEEPVLQKAAALALSPRGLALYLETGQGVSVLNADDGTSLREYHGLHPRQIALADSPGGTILAAYTDGTDSQNSSTSLNFHNASAGSELARVDKVIRTF